jgi:hypothetical protein
MESLKNLLIIRKLESNLDFYVSNNHNEIEEPFFIIQIVCDFIMHVSI